MLVKTGKIFRFLCVYIYRRSCLLCPPVTLWSDKKCVPHRRQTISSVFYDENEWVGFFLVRLPLASNSNPNQRKINCCGEKMSQNCVFNHSGLGLRNWARWLANGATPWLVRVFGLTCLTNEFLVFVGFKYFHNPTKLNYLIVPHHIAYPEHSYRTDVSKPVLLQRPHQ